MSDKKHPVGWLTDEGWQEAFVEAIRSGEVILLGRTLKTRPDGTQYYEVKISYKEDA